MQLKLFTVYDRAAQAYMTPFFLLTKGLAIRSFSETVNDPNHNFGKYSEDFTLFELGSYDDQKSKFEIYPAPVSLGVGVEFKILPDPRELSLSEHGLEMEHTKGE